MSRNKYYFRIFMMILLLGCEALEPQSVRDSESIASALAGMNIAKLKEASNYAGGSGCVMRGGKIVFTWGDINRLYDLKSTTKSIGVTALGLAIKDGMMRLGDTASNYYSNIGIPPDKNKENGWLDKITLLNLVTHTAGFDKPGGYATLLFEPGTAWAYSDAGPNWLADCLTIAYRQDLKDLMFDRVFAPLGISSSDLNWRDNAYREDSIKGIKRREFGSGIKANVKAMAKIGSLFLAEGEWNRQQIISKAFIEIMRKPVTSIRGLPVRNDHHSKFDRASEHYGLLWWNNGDGAMSGVPRDAFWSWGLHDSIIAVIPSLNLVIARAGDSIEGKRQPSFYRIFEPFIKEIVASVNHGAPYPNSSVISNIVWDDKSKIVRKAEGSDNWPMTWADDDDLYSAYGDGYGFEPKISKKLSMGFTRIAGTADYFLGENIRSIDEQFGDGSSGKKASGMLMVDGILYMWARNANHRGEGSQLAWSFDYGKNWIWSDWIFNRFGYCTFINFGPDYADARDNYVYTISHDNSSAYKRSDRFVLMRVPKRRIRDRSAYEFFVELSPADKPVWSRSIDDRDAIFIDPKRCHRSGISYNAEI